MAVSGYLSFVTVTALATAGCAPDTRSPEVAPISTAASPIRALDADLLRGHISVLADDGMEGRETGTTEVRKSHVRTRRRLGDQCDGID